MFYKMAKIIVTAILLLCFLTAETSAGGYGYGSGGYRAVKVVTQLETTTATVTETETETKTETVLQKLVVTKPCYGGSYKYHG